MRLLWLLADRANSARIDDETERRQHGSGMAPARTSQERRLLSQYTHIVTGRRTTDIGRDQFTSKSFYESVRVPNHCAAADMRTNPASRHRL